MSTTPVSLAPRHPPGRGGHITPEERRAIQQAHVAENLTKTQLAARFGRGREAIAGCLTGDDFAALQAAAWEQTRTAAIEGLRRHTTPAVQAWGTAIGKAAQAGNHKPSKDLLIATGVIAPDARDAGAKVLIIIGQPGQPAGTDPFLDLKPLDSDGNGTDEG